MRYMLALKVQMKLEKLQKKKKKNYIKDVGDKM